MKTTAHGSVMVREKTQMTRMMLRQVREVIWQRIGKQMARARSTEMATSVLMEAETLTPCRYDMALHTKRPSTQAVREGEEGQLDLEIWCY